MKIFHFYYTYTYMNPYMFRIRKCTPLHLNLSVISKSTNEIFFYLFSYLPTRKKDIVLEGTLFGRDG